MTDKEIIYERRIQETHHHLIWSLYDDNLNATDVLKIHLEKKLIDRFISTLLKLLPHFRYNNSFTQNDIVSLGSKCIVKTFQFRCTKIYACVCVDRIFYTSCNNTFVSTKIKLWRQQQKQQSTNSCAHKSIQK